MHLPAEREHALKSSWEEDPGSVIAAGEVQLESTRQMVLLP